MEYNGRDLKDFGSVMILSCDTKPFDDDFSFLNCLETTYSVTGPMYQVPKDMWSKGPDEIFSVTSLSRSEDSGEIFYSELYESCRIK